MKEKQYLIFPIDSEKDIYELWRPDVLGMNFLIFEGCLERCERIINLENGGHMMLPEIGGSHSLEWLKTHR